MSRFSFLILCIILSCVSYVFSADLTAPTLISAKIEPLTLNAGNPITVTIEAADGLNGSGVKEVTAFLNSPSNIQVIKNINLNNLFKNTYSSTVYIPEYCESGKWTLSMIILWDNVQNKEMYFYNVDYATATATFTLNTANPDLIPPSFSGIDISPFTVEDGSTITIKVKNVTDNLSGIKSVICSIRSSTLIEQGKSNISLDYDPATGAYSTEVFIPNYVKSGYWEVNSVKLQDKALNTKTYYYGSNYTDGYFIVNSVEDTLAPEISNVNISPERVDFGGSKALTLKITDNKSEIYISEANFISPSGKQNKIVPLTYNAGTGMYQSVFFVEPFYESGIWTVSYIRVGDKPGNERFYYHGREYYASFIVNQDWPQTEKIAPGIFEFNIPLSVKSSETITASCKITDNLSGVSFANAHFRSPTGKQTYNVRFNPTGNDYYEAKLYIPPFVEEGQWTVYSIYTEDNVRNSKTYYYANGDYENGTFTVINTSKDVTAPEIYDFSLIPSTTVDVTAGDQIIKIKCKITDDLSGIHFAMARVISPDKLKSYPTSLYPDGDGFYAGTVIIKRYSQPGEWSFSVYAEDNAQNFKWYIPTENLYLTGSGTVFIWEYPTTTPVIVSSQTYTVTLPEKKLLVISNPDLQPPDLSDFKISATQIKPGKEIIITCKATDDFSGVNYVRAYLSSEKYPNKYNINLYRVGTSNTYEGKYTFSIFDTLGKWTISTVIAEDNVKNFRSVDPGLKFAIVNIEDTTPPVLISVEVSPQTVIVGETVKILVKATDTIAALDSDNVYCDIVSSSGSQSYDYKKLTLENSTDDWASYSTYTAVHPMAEPGLWKVKTIYLGNMAWLNTTYQYGMDYTHGSTFTVVEPTFSGSIFCEGNGYTNNESIKLLINVQGPNIIQMQFSNDGILYSQWETYNSTKSWSLEPSEGIKTISAKFKNSIGAESSVFSSTITLDKTPPFSFIIFPENNKTYNILTSISGTSSDNFTIDKMELSLKNIDDNLYLNGANWITDEVFISVSGTNNWTYKTGELPDSKTYFVKVRGLDKAGNVQQLISTCTFTYIAPASHFAITGINEPLPAGTTTGITFEVKNKNNNRVINYTGTVKFESNDSRATLPANYTFTPEDKGVHTLNDSIILRTVGDITLKLIDTSDANVSSQKKIKVIPDIPAKITVSAIKTPVETCIPQDVNIEVRDKYENCVDTYTGTVTFESSDKRASLPTDYTFAISDYGKKTFTKSVSFKTTGYAYLKVYDKSDPNISGSQENIEVYTVLSEPVDSLLALPADLDKIKLEWQPSISLNVSQYNIYWDRSTGEMDFNNPVMTLAHPGNTYTFDGLKTETEYKFIVRGVNNAGYIENNMNIVNATPLSSAFETKATIKVPHTGHKISGNRITIVAEIINGEISDADNVLFEYRAANNNDWNTITPANSQDTNPDKSHPYFIHWDVTNIQAGTYNLRAIVTDRTGTKDKTPSAITVFVNHNNFDLQEQYNESTGEYIKTQKVNNARDNKIKIGDINVNNIIELLLPAQSLAVDSTTLKISYNPELRPENPYREPPVSPLWQIELGNEQSELKNDKEATLYFPYKDDNNDNKIDNTEFLEKDLVLKKFSTGKHKWEKITLQEVDYEKNICKARVSSFSYFRMFNALSERLSEVIIYPNPFKPSQGHKYVKFDKLSYSTTIKIYTLSGELVWAKENVLSGELIWDTRNSYAREVASGLYICLITNDIGDKRIMKIVILR